TTHGRRNKDKFKSNIDMLHYQKNNAVPLKKAEKMSKEELKGKIITGILLEKEKPEYVENYTRLIDSLKEKKQ
ncbi:MAG: 2-oxoacid:ferredoxin oxidoreductase subunit beta, partial [bacterium]